MVVAKMKLKLASVGKKKQKRCQFSYQKLKQKEVKQKFTIELKNRFSCLQVDETDEEHSEEPTVNAKLEKRWKTFKDSYNDTAKKVLGFQRGSNKPWISEGSWDKIDRRNEVKKKMLNAKSARIKEKFRADFKE